jgi:hypothetical protein
VDLEKVNYQSDDLLKTTPAERLQMMWQLPLDAWAFKGEPLDLAHTSHSDEVLRIVFFTFSSL